MSCYLCVSMGVWDVVGAFAEPAFSPPLMLFFEKYLIQYKHGNICNLQL